MTEWVQQWICIKFCIKLEHSSMESNQMIQKDAVLGNWWLVVLSQRSCSCITSCEEFFGQKNLWRAFCEELLVKSFLGKTRNHPSDSAPLQPRFGTLRLLTFPKTKITFEREEISDHWWDSGKYNRAADGNWENCVRSQGAYFERNWGIIVLCSMFLLSCIFFNKCLYFSYYIAGYLLNRPQTYVNKC